MLLVMRVELIISTESGVIIMEIHLRSGKAGWDANATANAALLIGARLWSKDPARALQSAITLHSLTAKL